MTSYRQPLRWLIMSFALALAAPLVAATAQEPGSKAPEGMPAPTPPAETKKLAFMVGQFTTDEKFHPSPMMPTAMTSKGRYAGRFILGGFFYSGDVDSEAMGGFKGLSLIRFDPAAGAYEMHWFDSMGTVHKTTGGKWKDEKTLFFETEMEHMGIKASVRSYYRINSPNSWTLSEEADYHDGKGWAPSMEIKFTRTSG